MARKSRAQKQFFDVGINFDINLNPMVDFLAAGNALTHSLDDKQYADAIMDKAFEDTDEAFNQKADAMAQTGYIKHMYEWGTLGVHKSRTNVRKRLGDPNARLWHTFTDGQGLDRSLYYAFLPSVANVPKPTVAETGMSSEVIAKLRDYVFTWKARVMEMGETVTIKPRRKYLLMPNYPQNASWMRPHDKKRGYRLLMNPIKQNPGAKYKGTFSKVWARYWMNEGEEILNNHINSLIISDYEPEFYDKRRTAVSSRPINAKVFQAKVKEKSKKIQMEKNRKARARATTQ